MGYAVSPPSAGDRIGWQGRSPAWISFAAAAVDASNRILSIRKQSDMVTKDEQAVSGLPRQFEQNAA